MKKIKKYLGEILLVVGAYITASNILNFNWRCVGNSGLFNPSEKCLEQIVYFYTASTQKVIAIGICLIIIGVLIIRNKKK